MTKNAVTVSHISKQYGAKEGAITALDDISLTVERGSFYGLLGPNGAGKTTLIGILGGLILPSSGSGRVLDYDIIGDTLTVRKHIGIVPQEAVYDPFFKVREALVFQSKYYGIHDNGVWIDTLLEKLQLQDKINTNTRALSGGMKRRLMIAQALVHKPPVIVLDEPTAGVDINLRLSLWKFIRELNDNGHTIILTTHYLEEAEALCKQVALMNHGKVVAEGSTRSLLAASTYAAILHVRAKGGDQSAFPTADKHTNDSDIYCIHNYNDIEPLLATYRQAGADIEEITVTPPKLEDVFVKIMQNT
ncbi:MAG: ABC transporter ATP-binding protein [Proteobacteria bacterium]|nr:ABC transporter ATP-binding protein [Pseudomonadota bacterium]